MSRKNITVHRLQSHARTAVIVIITLTIMTWLARWEMPVDTERSKLDSLKRESAKLQIY